MLFSSLEFLFLFLPISVGGYFILPRSLKNFWLLLSGLCFYGIGDEPDSSLDYPNRHIVLTHIKNITRDKDYAGLMTLHDPNYALNYCDRILLLKNGTIRSEINIKESSAEMIEERLSEVYGDIRVIKEEKIFVVIKK